MFMLTVPNPTGATLETEATSPARKVPPADTFQVPRIPLSTSHLFLLAASFAFFALHFVHLTADFPNFSRWMDWSKYTDEGWYGDAAIRHFLLGHWYVPGDFNPAVALPVWPALEALVFHFTGVSLIAARALTVVVFGGIMGASWCLVARSNRSDKSFPAGSVAVLLLAANPFCFVFTRLAILEPMLILLMLLALLAAQSASVPLSKDPIQVEGATSWREQTIRTLRANLLPILSLGLLLPLLILTKTTGLFLVPAIAWMLFASLGYKFLPFLRVGGSAAALGASLWLSYFLILVRPRYLLDYRYLFSANAYTHITRANFVTVIVTTLKDGKWFGPVLFTCAIAATILALTNLRRLRQYPLIPVLLLWAGGYTAFLAWHNNLQPRYYLVVAVPLTLLVPVAWRELVLPQIHSPRSLVLAPWAGALLFAAILIPDTLQTLSIVRHPQYTLLKAAQQIHAYIANDKRQDPSHNPLVLSISGSDLSLMTGLKSICDDFGTAELGDRVKQYRPGWYISWNLIEDDKMDALTPLFRVERVGTFPAMDDQDRNLLILYKLTPTDIDNGDTRRGRRRLRSRLGQQPSTSQLKH